jgi:protein-tyrosine phosphatase
MSVDAPAPQPAEGGRVLVLCTGNICRSPYIAHLLAAELVGTGVLVESAGTGAVVGAPMHEQSLRLLSDAGLDGLAFRARQVTPELIHAADLIIGATREHAAAVGWLVPEAFDRAHSLGDLAHALRDHAVDLVPGGGLSHVFTLAAGHRRAGRLHRSAERTDIVDPYLKPRRVWEQMTAQVHEHLPVVAAALRQVTTRPDERDA